MKEKFNFTGVSVTIPGTNRRIYLNISSQVVMETVTTKEKTTDNKLIIEQKYYYRAQICASNVRLEEIIGENEETIADLLGLYIGKSSRELPQFYGINEEKEVRKTFEQALRSALNWRDKYKTKEKINSEEATNNKTQKTATSI